MEVIKTVCPECGEEFSVYDVRGKTKETRLRIDLRKLVEEEKVFAANPGIRPVDFLIEKIEKLLAGE